MVSDRRSFGERLKRHRERRGIPLDAISDQTKIATSLFVGLENGDCSRWPAGLYSRAYVRAYAEAIGLNAEDVVDDFAALFGAKVVADGLDAPPPRRRNAGGLRLALAEDPADGVMKAARRAVTAGVEFVVAFVVAVTTYVFLDAGIWLTVGAALAYHAIGRILTDEPLVWWLYGRARAASASAAEVRAAAPAEHAPPAEDVPVGNAASTAA